LLIHLAKHFANAGSGIRSIVDIHLYNKRFNSEMDWSYIKDELEKIGLWKFGESIRELGRVWFDNVQSNDLYDEMTDYIMSSGISGSRKHAVVYSINTGVKTRRLTRIAKQLFWLKLFFPPLMQMKMIYPFLAKTPFLLPIFWILRGIKCLLYKRHQTLHTMKTVRSVSREDLNRAWKLHEKIGLVR
jgi:hypothetical protein